MLSTHQVPPALQPLLAMVRELPDDPSFAHLDPAERTAWLMSLRQLIDATESVFLQCLGDFDAQGDAQTLNAATTTQGWLRSIAGLAPGDANERVRIARGIRSHLSSAGACLHAGDVSYEQVRAIDHAVRRIPEPQQGEAVDLLTDLAKSADVLAVRIAGQKLKLVMHPDGALQEADKQFARRYLSMSPLLDGMTHVDGLLDSEAAAIVSAALAPFLTPVGRDDDRTTGQRRADGLVTLANAAMAADQLPHSAGVPTQLQVLVAIESFKDPTRNPPELVDSNTSSPYLTPVAFERISCDVAVRRVVMGPQSLPLDVGRTKRLFTPGQQIALRRRDGGCRFPDCHLPSRYTDAHHIVSWQSGGTSSLNNGVLLCRHHHRSVHEGGWSIDSFDTTNNLVRFRSPDGREFVSGARAP